ncbi:hypothetical protein PTKIN_Ptkin03bG0254900 [Pterospermum kingtungense]
MDISHYSNLSFSFLAYLFLLLFHLLLFVSSCSGNSKVRERCIETERKVLVDFKECLIDPDGRLSSWVGLDCCKWEGVTCNNRTGHVTELYLVQGSLGGSIPASIENLSSLRLLRLSNNNLNGTIPASLWNLTQLSMLSLASNKLEGSLPESLGGFKNLQEFCLYNNSFWGSIPASIGNLSSLRLLDLSQNNLNGTIPQSIGKLGELSTLDLSSNQMEGVLTEAHLANLTKLDSFSLKTYPNSSLIFNIKYDWIPPFRLTFLELDNCQVGPSFPVWLQVQTNLSHVVISNAGISDTIEEQWFATLLSRCGVIDLSNNKIKGKLPSQIHSETPDIINLSRNRFEGQIPLWKIPATQLYLHRNSFAGSVPENIGELMPNLETLFLSRNQINGTFPSSICKMTELLYLSVGHNRFSGELPNCWDNLSYLKVLDVSNNTLSGKIPSSLFSLCNLILLIMSNNNLRRSIPHPQYYCQVPSLYILQLRSNLLEGNIPEHLCLLSEIRDLDLSDNNFMGSIPKCFHNFTALKYGNKSLSYEELLVLYESEGNEQTIWVGTKGSELEFSRTLLEVKNIDLSKNNLTGGIPDGIFSLAFLDSLNLSRNHLSGSIPRSIGDLRLLESLDLSNNNFSGMIPPSLSSLTLLNHLKLSYNNLSGRIPTGNQLQTLNDSSNYEGNPLLCGVPLETRCTGDDSPPTPPPRRGAGGGDSKDKLWFYLSIAIGYIVGFWSVCGTLALKESWRHAYYQYVDNLKERLLLWIGLLAARSQRKFGRGNN